MSFVQIINSWNITNAYLDGTDAKIVVTRAAFQVSTGWIAESNETVTMALPGDAGDGLYYVVAVKSADGTLEAIAGTEWVYAGADITQAPACPVGYTALYACLTYFGMPSFDDQHITDLRIISVPADGVVGAAGNDTNVQFNNAGVLAGSSDFTWDDAGKVLTVGELVLTSYTGVGGEFSSAGLLNFRSASAPGSSNTDGFDIQFQSGLGDGSGDGGDAIFGSEGGGATGNGGVASVVSGIGGGTSGNGGRVEIESGKAATIGNGGEIALIGGVGGATSGDGGTISMSAGNATTEGDGGNVEITPGVGAGAGVDGVIKLLGTVELGATGDVAWDDAGKVLTIGGYIVGVADFSAYAANGAVDDGGLVTMYGGGAKALSNGRGGAVILFGGAGDGSGFGGGGDVTGGTGGATGNGGDASVLGGHGGITSGDGGRANLSGGDANADGNGGNVVIKVGAGAGGGADGVINLNGDTNVITGIFSAAGIISAIEPAAPVAGQFWVDTA